MPRLMRLVAVVSPQTFASGALHVRFVVDRVTWGQVFLQVLQFSLSVSFYPMLFAHSFVCFTDAM
jgi:hypothetical protein